MQTISKKLFIIVALIATPLLANRSTTLMAPTINILISASTFQNELDKPIPEFGLGLGASMWLFELDQWIFGAGARVHLDKSLFVGTDTVSISPLSLYEETSGQVGFKISGLRVAIIPYAGAKVQVGADIINRRVLKTFSSDVALFAALGGFLGITYSIDNIGVSLEYGFAAGLRPLRQSLLINLGFLI